MQRPTSLEKAIAHLRSSGLNLFSSLASIRLPQPVKALLTEANVGATDKSHFILIGNAGKRLWDNIAPWPSSQQDPIDDYSIEAAELFATAVFGTDPYKILYPGGPLVPLQQLGEHAGWHYASPFGVGVNSRWGPWFAYRCLLMVNGAYPEITRDDGPSPCPTCKGTPCITGCPAEALSTGKPIDMARCAQFRLQPDSPCADRCLARISCPVATNERYPCEQIQYHYRLSLETLRHYT